MLCRPFEHSADVVVHSVTKFRGGRSYVTGGIAVFAVFAVFAGDALYREVWRHAVEFGAVTDPFAAWPTLLGLAGGHEAGLRLQKAVRVIELAPSLGGTKALILHPASHRQLDAAPLRAASIGPGTIRIAVGIERPDDLTADLDRALTAA